MTNRFTKLFAKKSSVHGNSHKSNLRKNLFLYSFQVFAIGVLCTFFTSACQQRMHIHDSYSTSLRSVFAVQLQSRNKMITPLSAEDAKRVLNRRGQKGDGKNKKKRGGRGGSAQSQGLGNLFSLEE